MLWEVYFSGEGVCVIIVNGVYEVGKIIIFVGVWVFDLLWDLGVSL